MNCKAIVAVRNLWNSFILSESTIDSVQNNREYNSLNRLQKASRQIISEPGFILRAELFDQIEPGLQLQCVISAI